MDVDTLKDLLQLLPNTMCVNKSTLKPYFGDKPPEYSFIMNGSSFYDHIGKYEDADLVSFEVFKEDRVIDDAVIEIVEEKAMDDTNTVETGEVTENPTPKPELTIKTAESGVIVNSKTYLKDQNWNTLLSLDGLFQCAVCDKIMTPDSVDAHISSDAHRINLDRCRPLTEYELSIIRKIEYYYHCGVCNFLDINVNDHLNTDSHKQSLMHAVNKALEINKNADNKSPIGETKTDLGINESSDVIAVENKPANIVHDTIETKSCIDEPSVNSSVANKPLTKEQVPANKTVRKNRPKVIGNLAAHNIKIKKQSPGPIRVIPFLNLNPSNRKESSKGFELNPGAFPNLRPNGITLSPLFNLNTENSAPKGDTEQNNPCNPSTIQSKSNLKTENSAPKSNTEQNPLSVLFGNKVETQKTVSYASAAKKVLTQSPEFVLHEYKDRTVKAKYDSWHMLLKRKNKTFYCMACTETNIRDKMLHCCSVTHVENLDKCTIVDAFGEFFIRKVGDKFFHCGHCNNLQYPPDMAPHIAKMHPYKTQTDKEAKNPDPIQIEYTANAKNVNVGAPRRSATPESTKSSDSVRTTDSESVNPKRPTNIYTSEVKICPFDMELTLNVLYYNAVFILADKLACGLCDCFIKEDPVQHICGTRHTEILRRTPFITNYNNNLIREVRDKLHCALCNAYIPHESVFTHIMNPPHTSLLARASTFAQMRNAPQIRPPAPQIRPPVSQTRPPAPVLTYTPVVQVPNMNTVTNTMCSWWQSVPRFMRSHMVTMMPFRAPMVFPSPARGPVFNPYLYPRYTSPIMPVQNVAAPSAPRVPGKVEPERDVKQDIEPTAKNDVCVNEQKPDRECRNAKNKEKCVKKTKDKQKKSDNGIVKDSKKAKKDSPAKKKSVINEIKRSVDHLKAHKSDNDENFDISKVFKANGAKITFGNDDSLLIKIDDTIRQRKSFSEVAKMAPKKKSPVKSEHISAVTKLPLDKHKVSWDENKVGKQKTPTKSDNSLKIVDVAVNKKVFYDINKKDPSTTITPTNDWLLKEQNLVTTSDEKYFVNEFNLVTKKSKSSEFKESNTVWDKAKCTEDPDFTITEKSNEPAKDMVEISLDDMKLVSELYEPEEKKHNTNENRNTKAKEATVEKIKVTFDDNRKGTQKEKAKTAKENESSKCKLNAEENKRKEVNKSKDKAPNKDNETKMEYAESIDDASSINESIIDVNDIGSEDYDMEEYIYLNLKNYMAKITFSSYNSLVPVGDGNRYCFVCWETVYIDLKKHVESNKHLENMKSSKYMDHYNDNMIRWKNSTHHCSVCNVIITGSMQTHLSWQHHAATLLETRKTVRQLTKDMKKTNYRQLRAVTTKKNYTCVNPVKLKKSICDNNFF